MIDDFGENIEKWQLAGGIGIKHKEWKFSRTIGKLKNYLIWFIYFLINLLFKYIKMETLHKITQGVLSAEILFKGSKSEKEPQS